MDKDSITESVDSIYRDSADTQYMLIQTNFSKSPKQLTYKPLLHPTVHLRVFSCLKTHSVSLKSIAKVPNQKVTRQMFFFLLLLLQTGYIVQICVTLSRWFSHKTAAFSLSSALAHRFFPGMKSREAIRTAHWRTMASFTMPFFLHMYACAQIT